MVHRIDHISQSLSDAIEWCARRTAAEGRNRYRSRVLEPMHDIGTCTDHMDRIAVTVADVVRRRRELLATERCANDTRSDGTIRGRLLAFFPNRTICDGVGRDETNGFLDGCNVPPWDTWVWLVDDFLVSYVPAEMVADTGFAIVATADESIVWLDDVRRENVLPVADALAGPKP
jgi:hypothetical protein